MSRLFYPILYSVTVALAAMLWTRHGFPTQWLGALGVAVAQAQSPAPSVRSAPPTWNGAANVSPRPRRLPPTDPPDDATPADRMARSRQAPYTRLRIDAPGGPRAMEVTRPVPVASAKVVAQVGNEVILAADVLPQVNEEFLHVQSQYPPEKWDELLNHVMHKHVEQLVRNKLVVSAMKKEIPEDKFPEVEKQMVRMFEDFYLPMMKKKIGVKSDLELEAQLKKEGSSMKKLRQAFIEGMLVNEWQKKEIKFDKHVSHEEMMAYFHDHYSEYEFPAKVRFEEIRVNYGRRRDKRQAWSEISDLARRVYSGARLADLAKAHSESIKADQGGLHDWTNKGSLKCEALDDALFTLPIGVLSNVIDDGRGFVIVRVLDRSEAGVTSFHDAQAGIVQKITTQREQEAKAKKHAEFFEKERPKVWTIFDEAPPSAEKPGGTKRR